jgi:ATP-dependent Clp protease adaptor protein ClpS
MSTKRKIQEDVDVLEKEVNLHEIILFNDDVNTFDFVIECLIEICDHTAEQAEQCALLVHYKGKCAVKTGEYDELKPRCTQLLTRGLSAEII